MLGAYESTAGHVTCTECTVVDSVAIGPCMQASSYSHRCCLLVVRSF